MINVSNMGLTLTFREIRNFPTVMVSENWQSENLDLGVGGSRCDIFFPLPWALY